MTEMTARMKLKRFSLVIEDITSDIQVSDSGTILAGVITKEIRISLLIGM